MDTGTCGALREVLQSLDTMKSSLLDLNTTCTVTEGYVRNDLIPTDYGNVRLLMLAVQDQGHMRIANDRINVGQSEGLLELAIVRLLKENPNIREFGLQNGSEIWYNFKPVIRLVENPINNNNVFRDSRNRPLGGSWLMSIYEVTDEVRRQAMRSLNPLPMNINTAYGTIILDDLLEDNPNRIMTNHFGIDKPSGLIEEALIRLIRLRPNIQTFGIQNGNEVWYDFKGHGVTSVHGNSERAKNMFRDPQNRPLGGPWLMALYRIPNDVHLTLHKLIPVSLPVPKVPAPPVLAVEPRSRTWQSDTVDPNMKIGQIVWPWRVLQIGALGRVSIATYTNGLKILQMQSFNTTVLLLAGFSDFHFQQSRTIEIEVVYMVFSTRQKRIVQGSGHELGITLRSENNRSRLSAGGVRVVPWEGDKTYTAKYAKWRSEVPVDGNPYAIQLACFHNHSDGWIGVRHVSITQVPE